MPATLLTTLEQEVPRAEKFYPQIDGYAAIVRQDGKIVGAGGAAQRGRDYTERPGSELKIESGERPAAADEVVVETRTAAEGRIDVGDRVTIVTQRSTQTMRVVGIFSLGDDQVGGVVTYVGFAPDVAQRLLIEPGHYSAIWSRPRQGVSQEHLVEQIAAVVPLGYEVKTGQEQVAEFKNELRTLFALLGSFLLVFAGVSVFVGSFIIFNTFTMLIAQRTRELAVLRAVGASRGQVTRAVLGEAIGVGFLGSTLGLLTGVGVAFVLRLLFEQFAGGSQLPLRTPVIGLSTMLWSYAVGMVITPLAAYLPARRAAKIPPVAALRDDATIAGRALTRRLVGGSVPALLGVLALAGGVSVGGESGAALVVVGGLVMLVAVPLLSPFLSRPVIALLGWPIARLTGAVGRLSQENARRDPRRSAATASALMIGLALVSVATVMTGSVSASAARTVERQFGADLSMDPRGLTGFSLDAVARVAAVPGVRSVTPVQLGTIRVADEEVPVAVSDPTGLTTPTKLEIDSGAGTLGTDELLVEATRAAERGWRVGSTMQGQYPDQTRATFRVAGIFADNEVLGQPFIMSPASYRPHAPMTLIQKAYIDLEDDDVARGRESLQAALRGFPNIQLEDREDAKSDARQDTDQVLNVILVLLVLSVVIAALGIVNTLGLSVIERTREIGLLRAVGMDRRQVRSMIRYESVVIALFGAALGITLGVTIGCALQQTLAADGIGVLSVPVGRLGLYLLSAVVIGVVAGAWPAWRAARMDVLHAIHQV